MKMNIETRKRHLFNTVKAHTMKPPQDAVLCLALFSDDGTAYNGPCIVSCELPQLILLLGVSFQASPDFKAEFLAASEPFI